MLEPGASVAGYRVERVIGRGGMGTVYLARHPELPRSDALKVLDDSVRSEETRRQFMREAEVAATLDHPNVVAVYNRGTYHAQGADAVVWIAMQYIAGTDCARELAASLRGPTARAMEPAKVAHIIGQVGRGLDHAHRKGLLHRDVKPGNILLGHTEHDDEQRVLITDFGVAGFSSEMTGSAATVLATLSYASPEQLRGDHVDARTDQYSLAATTFHLLTGVVPFAAPTTKEVIEAHLGSPVPSVSARAAVPAAVDAVMAKAMAKSRDDRYPSCRAFADAFAAALAAPASTDKTPSAPVAAPAVSPTVSTANFSVGTDPSWLAGTVPPASRLGSAATIALVIFAAVLSVAVLLLALL